MSGEYFIYNLSDADSWTRCLDLLPIENQDIYITPAYYALYETAAAQAECFVYREKDALVLYPYLKTHLNPALNFQLSGTCYDIEGACGYNGFIGNEVTEAIIDNFSNAFESYCKSNHVIAEFTRFNPLLNNHAWAKHLMVKLVNKNIVVDLTLSDEELWMRSYEHAARKNVNKAKRNGLTVEACYGSELTKERLNDFIKIYLSTMDRNNAEPAYYFDKIYFENICKRLGKYALFFFALADGKPVACELVLYAGQHAYSFLGGTLEQYYPSRPNNLLKHEAILKLKRLGMHYYCLGGGPRGEDGIYKYKRTFAKYGERNFYIGSKIYNNNIYDALCDDWEKTYPHKKERYGKYLLKYRY